MLLGVVLTSSSLSPTHILAPRSSPARLPTLGKPTMAAATRTMMAPSAVLLFLLYSLSSAAAVVYLGEHAHAVGHGAEELAALERDAADAHYDLLAGKLHTLSTAGGSPAPGAAVFGFGFGNGTASGASPRARVAAYRVCYPPVNGSERFDADNLAAFDAAIHDGVHVLSLSLGGDPGEYFKDGIAIGSFHAVRYGIPVVCSAGNSGPGPGTVSKNAPWIFTAGASTMDREFPSYIVFGGHGQTMASPLVAESTGNEIIADAHVLPPMSNQGSRVRAGGLVIVLIAVSAGISCGGFGLLLSLLGVLAGVSLIVASVWIADDPTAYGGIAFPGVGAPFPCRNLSFLGLIMASSAMTVAAGATSPTLCFGLYALFVLGISLITMGVRGE